MEREYDKENVLAKMRELRDKRDEELKGKGEIANVKYMGKIKIKGEEKAIYLVTEKIQKDKIANEKEEYYKVDKYFTEDGEFLGANNKSDAYNFIILSEKNLNEKELIEQLEGLDKEGLEDLNKIENERIEEIARVLGISKEDIGKLSEIDAEKEIEKGEKGEEKVKGNNEKEEQEKTTLDKEEVEKISSKSEIKTNQKVTDNLTIAQLLGVQDKGYKKICIIYSDKLQDNSNSTKFSFAGIKEDGSAEKIDSLEQGYGKNPTKNINALNRDGSGLEEKQVNSIYKVKGQDEMQLAVDIGEMGTIEPTLLRTPREDNEEAISIPIETYNIKPTTREVREYMNRNKNTSVEDDLKRAEEHKKAGCDDISKSEIDDNEHNDGHIHNEGEEETQHGIKPNDEFFNECATKILENEKIAEVYNRDDIVEFLKSKAENEPGWEKNLGTEEFLKQAEEEIEDLAEREHEPPRKSH